jgi:hypothetical protein
MSIANHQGLREEHPCHFLFKRAELPAITNPFETGAGVSSVATVAVSFPSIQEIL